MTGSSFDSSSVMRCEIPPVTAIESSMQQVTGFRSRKCQNRGYTIINLREQDRWRQIPADRGRGRFQQDLGRNLATAEFASILSPDEPKHIGAQRWREQYNSLLSILMGGGRSLGGSGRLGWSGKEYPLRLSILQLV